MQLETRDANRYQEIEDPQFQEKSSWLDKLMTPPAYEKKFLIVPSALAGLCLGINNFLLGYVSELGYYGALIYSAGALMQISVYRLGQALYYKSIYGEYMPISKSNLLMLDDQGNKVVKLINVKGLVLRAILNASFQFSIIIAFSYAKKADLNGGIVTSLFSAYCVFTAIIVFFIFGEKLNLRFILGMLLFLMCVGCISFANLGDTSASQEDIENIVNAIEYGLLAPMMIASSIATARYFTTKHGYNTIDYSLDTFTLVALGEIYFFLSRNAEVPYTPTQLSAGIVASFFQIMGTILMCYAATYGLAGPASAMVQSQSVVHVVLASFIRGIIPQPLEFLGMFFAIMGAIVVSLDPKKQITDIKRNIEKEELLLHMEGKQSGQKTKYQFEKS